MPMLEKDVLKEKIRQLPHRPGVYLMKDRLGKVLYIGKAKNLKKRVASYFQGRRKYSDQPKIAAMISLVRDIAIVEVRSETEALLLEGRLIKEWKPKYNTTFVDDKRFLMIRVDLQKPLPQFCLCRTQSAIQAKYYGPFVNAQAVRKVLVELRRQFGILLGDTRPQRLADGCYRLYDDVRGEIYGHDNIVSPAAYQNRVALACAFLDGKTKEWLESLQNQMNKAAESRDYEKAAELRDMIASFRATLATSRKFKYTPQIHKPSIAVLEQLQKVLQLPSLPNEIECFDISHISGSFVVASMVRFSAGKANKQKYRRYKIRTFIGNDDYRAMEEVVGRRYRRLQQERQLMPDLVVIDGGQGQVHAALKAFVLLNVSSPPIIGLAKRHETIIFADNRKPLQLALSNPSLQLLQHIRDEAHRFANTFNAQWRSQQIKASVLDRCHGLGAHKRNALLTKFKSIQRLRQATLAELQETPGIGPKLASVLYHFLRR